MQRTTGSQRGMNIAKQFNNCHPEFISGSSTMLDEEILKQVQNDRGSDRKAVFSGE